MKEWRHEQTNEADVSDIVFHQIKQKKKKWLVQTSGVAPTMYWHISLCKCYRLPLLTPITA